MAHAPDDLRHLMERHDGRDRPRAQVRPAAPAGLPAAAPAGPRRARRHDDRERVLPVAERGPVPRALEPALRRARLRRVHDRAVGAVRQAVGPHALHVRSRLLRRRRDELQRRVQRQRVDPSRALAGPGRGRRHLRPHGCVRAGHRAGGAATRGHAGRPLHVGCGGREQGRGPGHVRHVFDLGRLDEFFRKLPARASCRSPTARGTSMPVSRRHSVRPTFPT